MFHIILSMDERIEELKSQFDKDRNDNKNIKNLFSEDEIIDKSLKRKNGKIILDGKEYTFEELYNKYLENENFRGKVANFENVEKYIKLSELAKELKEKCTDITKIIFSKPETDSPWAFVHIDFLWMLSLKREQAKIISEMIRLSSSFSINGSSFSTVRLSFGIGDVWEK